ncbi:MAG: CPBP family intramembrane metalloprotease [Clostridia bacterium]|nr:CPBP family intramembrane metalloprotease [Clostridia bacterium]
MGALLVAVYLRGKSLWALILLHGFYDMSLLCGALFTKTHGIDPVLSLAKEQTSFEDMLITCAMAPVYILITLFLLRKSKCDEILERYKSGEQQD